MPPEPRASRSNAACAGSRTLMLPEPASSFHSPVGSPPAVMSPLPVWARREPRTASASTLPEPVPISTAPLALLEAADADRIAVLLYGRVRGDAADLFVGLAAAEAPHPHRPDHAHGHGVPAPHLDRAGAGVDVEVDRAGDGERPLERPLR